MRVAEDADLIIGVGTHLDTRTAAICDTRGRAVSQLQVPATSAGYAQLLAWAPPVAGEQRLAWAVEGTTTASDQPEALRKLPRPSTPPRSPVNTREVLPGPV